MPVARSIRCLDCIYCRQIRYDTPAKRDYRNNYTCDYLLITQKIGDKGKDPDKCLLFERKDKGYGYKEKKSMD